MQTPLHQLSLQEATDAINRAASDPACLIQILRHASYRQGERCIPDDFLYRVLREGTVIACSTHIFNGQVQRRYEVQLNAYGDPTSAITVIVGPLHLVVITTFSKYGN